MPSDTLTCLTEVFHEVFDDDDIVVTRESTADQIEAWDSLMHVSLVVAVERRFAVRFTSAQVAQLQNVGEMVDLVDSLT